MTNLKPTYFDNVAKKKKTKQKGSSSFFCSFFPHDPPSHGGAQTENPHVPLEILRPQDSYQIVCLDWSLLLTSIWHPPTWSKLLPTLRWGSTSSAPSIVRSRTWCESRSDNRIPRDGGDVLEGEVGEVGHAALVSAAPSAFRQLAEPKQPISRRFVGELAAKNSIATWLGWVPTLYPAPS